MVRMGGGFSQVVYFFPPRGGVFFPEWLDALFLRVGQETDDANCTAHVQFFFGGEPGCGLANFLIFVVIIMTSDCPHRAPSRHLDIIP